MAEAASRLLARSASLSALKNACARSASSTSYPLATSIKHNIPIYQLPTYSSLKDEDRASLQDEWYRILLQGPGVFVTSGMYKDKHLLDSVTGVYRSIIEAERQRSMSQGDHFAAGGENNRIWNSFSKHALADSPSFLRYYSNPWLSLVCSAWLGPGYRTTAQVNDVKPGGGPQECHADYHLGFQTAEAAGKYPRGAHYASQFLTLQGAVAHVDMPIESGPTRLLPFSQTVEGSYMAYRHPEIREYFQANYVSLPLKKGDGLFFNPALFHAAGANRTSGISRLVNLLQISSAFGKPMETIEAYPIVESCWEDLLKMHEDHGMTHETVSVIAAIGNGYPFPTNLDRNSPDKDDVSPPSEQTILYKHLEGKKNKSQILQALSELASKSRA